MSPSATGAQSGDRGEHLGGSAIIQGSNDDGLPQSDDDGGFQTFLYFEYSLKGGLIFYSLKSLGPNY